VSPPRRRCSPQRQLSSRKDSEAKNLKNTRNVIMDEEEAEEAMKRSI